MNEKVPKMGKEKPRFWEGKALNSVSHPGPAFGKDLQGDGKGLKMGRVSNPGNHPGRISVVFVLMLLVFAVSVFAPGFSRQVTIDNKTYSVVPASELQPSDRIYGLFVPNFTGQGGFTGRLLTSGEHILEFRYGSSSEIVSTSFPTPINLTNITANITQIKILDKKEEHLKVVPGTEFCIERTVSGPTGSNATFVPLYTSGLKLERIEVVEAEAKPEAKPRKKPEGKKLLLKTGAAKPRARAKLSEIPERREVNEKINSIKKSMEGSIGSGLEVPSSDKLPVFSFHSNQTILVCFRAPSWDDMRSGRKPSSGRISYLALAASSPPTAPVASPAASSAAGHGAATTPTTSTTPAGHVIAGRSGRGLATGSTGSTGAGTVASAGATGAATGQGLTAGLTAGQVPNLGQGSAGGVSIIYDLEHTTWWDSSYAYRRSISCTNMDDGVPLVINGSNGFTLSGNKQIVWTYCSGTGTALYYNDYTDYVVANDSTQLPMEVEMGNGTSYNPADLWTNGLLYVGHLDLNGTDSSPLSNNATPSGFDGDERVLGKIGYGLDFDGSNDFLSWGAGKWLCADFDNGLTAMLWYNLDTVSVSQMPISLEEEYLLPYLTTTPNICTYIDRISTSTTDIPNADTFYFYTGTSSGGSSETVKHYRNGTEMNSTSGTRDCALDSWTSRDDRIGASYQGNYCVNGTLDEVRLYNRTVSAAEINQTYQNAIGTSGYGNLGAEETRYKLEGIVQDKYGNPISGATVVAVLQSDNTVIGNTTTNSTGGFSIGVASTGNYTVYAYKEGNVSLGGDIAPWVEVT